MPSKKQPLTQAKINSALQTIDNNQLMLNEASGKAVSVELRMRLMGQFSQPIRNKVKELVAKQGRRNKSDNYWDCDLCYLDDAIEQVFHDLLVGHEITILKNFRPLRNKLLHADFIGLMKEMDIEPTSREIYKGERTILASEEISEAILSVDRNGALRNVQTRAEKVNTILNKIINSLVQQK